MSDLETRLIMQESEIESLRSRINILNKELRKGATIIKESETSTQPSHKEREEWLKRNGFD